jgi:hypothetical protein
MELLLEKALFSACPFKGRYNGLDIALLLKHAIGKKADFLVIVVGRGHASEEGVSLSRDVDC